ncbi:hypothetical protein MML48_1g17547 [Holotrichia oblita]|uniref:Uncharacterized protein n=1 Tax=Holotrichia oblita TaxID=644536 RepID=A0ACB9TXD9_HOLOL|nr:hypothetical protein MML48_1g17547 [Holotrichia oblita]
MVTLGVSNFRFSRFYKGGLTLHETLEIAYADDVDAIYIEPPDAGVLTDQDSGDEDGGGTIDNLPGAQLRANAEVVLRGTDRDEILVSPQNVTDIKWISGDLEHTHTTTLFRRITKCIKTYPV